MQKFTDEELQQLQEALNNEMSVRAAARDILGKESRESSIRNAIKRGELSRGEPTKNPTETFNVRTVDTKEYDNSSVLVISDMHIPYQHPDAIEFLQYLKDKYQPTRVICTGDELDKHALSYHDSDPDLASAGDELKKSLPTIATLKEMFPVMDLIDSNHGSMVWRKAKTHGIPKHYIKSYNEVLGVDDGWRWHFDLTITLPNGQKCYFHHGKTSQVLRLSQQMGMCAVQGHYHETFGISYWGNPTGLYWGLQCGCLIDDKSLAFSYNNVNIKRPIIGTAVIINGQPILEPMVLDDNGRWLYRKS
jgi:predicted phosphodiesterase